MDDETKRRLNALNRRFYGESAVEFAATRRRAWAGWRELVPRLAGLCSRGPLAVLDVGCGNGRFLRFLADESIAVDRYVGLDVSQDLLALARADLEDLERAALVRADVVADGLAALVPRAEFDLVVLFGVLHHVPGFMARRALLRACAARLRPGGAIVLTLWRFLTHDPDLAAKVISVEECEKRTGIAIDATRLEAGDRLLPFGESADAVRYAHHFGDEEAALLIAGLPLTAVDAFTADGHGEGNQYLVLEANTA